MLVVVVLVMMAMMVIMVMVVVLMMVRVGQQCAIGRDLRLHGGRRVLRRGEVETQRVGALAAMVVIVGTGILAAAPDGKVVAAAAAHGVASGAAVDDVIAAAAANRVVASATRYDIIALVAAQDVPSGPADDRVVTRPATDDEVSVGFCRAVEEQRIAGPQLSVHRQRLACGHSAVRQGQSIVVPTRQPDLLEAG